MRILHRMAWSSDKLWPEFTMSVRRKKESLG